MLAVIAMPTLAEEPEPVDQIELNELVAKDPMAAFILAFDAGDELTEARFTAARGVGARVREGQRFTRYPRADLAGEGEWASHLPLREGGPQAQSCITCHASPIANGAGGVALNVAVDPKHSGDPALYLERNTLHLFALGAVQRIAEEMTSELRAIETALGEQACIDNASASSPLVAKDVEFGVLAAAPVPAGDGCHPQFDYTAVEGIDDDLIVRMFGWKGNHASIREFARAAAHNELGMQAVELVGETDGDHDGTTSELSVGDLTALTVYMAALERPTSLLELDELGIVPLPPEERADIEAGESLFAEVDCVSCHKPQMTIDDPVFTEPSTHPDFAELEMPSGDLAEVIGLAPETAIKFDLTADQPNNQIDVVHGGEFRLGAFPSDADGRAVVSWYSDFRRHDMGEALADPVDVHGFGASVWPTRSLAGVGSTGPWLHNGHATTLEEAIQAHGGEAVESRVKFTALDPQDQARLIAFLENLVIINLDPEDEEEEHG
ncbi:MAG: di-heme oxidoredictase family protein [Pseudomonadota bacterium]